MQGDGAVARHARRARGPRRTCAGAIGADQGRVDDVKVLEHGAHGRHDDAGREHLGRELARQLLRPGVAAYGQHGRPGLGGRRGARRARQHRRAAV